jgi:mannose-6-phosphate isomerase-like protein (cupin superfamily)
MKSIKPAFASLIALVLATLVFSQTPVPVLQEPRHHLKLANEFVRVIDAAVPVGDATLFHTHSIDNVPVCISGGETKIEVLGNPVAYTTISTGAVSFAQATYSHRISNVGYTPMRFIDAEILRSSGRPATTPRLDAIHGGDVLIDNDRVRAVRIALEPGETTGSHHHFLPWLTVVVTGRRMAIESNGKTQTEEVEPGDFRWQTIETAHAIRNSGRTRLELVIIEWR